MQLLSWDHGTSASWSDLDATGRAGSGSLRGTGNPSFAIEVAGQCINLGTATLYDFGGSIYIPSGQSGTGDAFVTVSWIDATGCDGVQIRADSTASVSTAFDGWVALGQKGVMRPDKAISARFQLFITTTPDSKAGLTAHFDDTFFAERVTADLAITKSGPTSVPLGQTIEYTLSISNAGPFAAMNVIVTDTLPTGVTFISAKSSQGNCDPAIGRVTCNLGEMLSEGKAQITLVVRPDAVGTYTNRASVDAKESDPNMGNNSASRTTSVIASANLSITKADSPDPAAAGSNLTYTLTISNGGPSRATGVVVKDTLPGGVTFASASSTPSSGTIPPSGTTLTVTASPTSLPVGTNTGTVNVTTPTGSNLANLPVSVNLVTPVTSVTKKTPPPNSVIIPAVAHAAGLNSKWQSDIRVVNPSGQSLKYELNFTPSRTDATKGLKQAPLNLAAGQATALDDVVKPGTGSDPRAKTSQERWRSVHSVRTAQNEWPLFPAGSTTPPSPAPSASTCRASPSPIL